MALFPQALLIAVGLMTAAWVVSVALRRTDVADVAWGLVFVTLSWWALLVAAERPAPPRVWLVAALVTAWGFRLALHIARRNFAAGRREDERYARMRERAGRRWAAQSLVSVFWLQAGLAWIVAWPIIAVAASGRQRTLAWTDALGVLVWAVGLAFEVVGDRQLARWLADPAHRGRPLTTGLWGWTRHPNYFGDALAWWGIGIVALAAPLGPVALIGPLVMTLLLRYVSGVPLLEQRHVGDESWERYRARVPVFWPRPPGKR